MDATQRDGCFPTTTTTTGETTTTTTSSLGPGAEMRTKITVTNETTILKRRRWKAQLEIAGWVGAMSTTQLQTAKWLLFEK